jgi:hypothetical protein
LGISLRFLLFYSQGAYRSASFGSILNSLESFSALWIVYKLRFDDPILQKALWYLVTRLPMSSHMGLSSSYTCILGRLASRSYLCFFSTSMMTISFFTNMSDWLYFILITPCILVSTIISALSLETHSCNEWLKIFFEFLNP